MKNFFKTARKHPRHFTLALCSHILFVILVIYCITNNTFHMFFPTDFTPNVYISQNSQGGTTSTGTSTENSDTDAAADTDTSHASSETTEAVKTTMERIEDLYQQGVRYVRCTVPTLYYSGYDCTSYGKITGHYYYSLDNATCTVYLLSTEMLKGMDSVPITLTDQTFLAQLSRNDSNIKSLLRYISTDIDWNYYSLSQCTGSIVLDQEAASIKTAYFLCAVLLFLFAANLFQVINIWHRYFRKKEPINPI